MSNASLKEQLQAVASQLTEKTTMENKPKRKFERQEKSSKPKPKWLDYVQYGVDLLRTYFPACFRAPNEVKPLKKGIKEDLIKRLSAIETIVTEDKACMVKSLSLRNTTAYHKTMLEGRYIVWIKSDGMVTAEEAKYSLERQQAKLLARQNANQVLNSHKVRVCFSISTGSKVS